MTTQPAFHLVVTCVKRKKDLSAEKVRLDTGVTRETVDQSYRGWLKRLQAATLGCSAKDLYMGATWNAAIDAFNEIDRNIFKPHLWVVSCGYGLIGADDRITSYRLTFKHGEADSLCSEQVQSEERKILVADWWDKLTVSPPLRQNQPSSLRELIYSLTSQDQLLMAAGEEYYSAVATDLSMADNGKVAKQCVFVGKAGIFDVGFPEVFKQKHDSWPEGRCGDLMLRLGEEFGGCNKVQVLNRRAQYLIKNYFNRGIVPMIFPAE